MRGFLNIVTIVSFGSNFLAKKPFSEGLSLLGLAGTAASTTLVVLAEVVLGLEVFLAGDFLDFVVAIFLLSWYMKRL